MCALRRLRCRLGESGVGVPEDEDEDEDRAERERGEMDRGLLAGGAEED